MVFSSVVQTENENHIQNTKHIQAQKAQDLRRSFNRFLNVSINYDTHLDTRRWQAREKNRNRVSFYAVFDQLLLARWRNFNRSQHDKTRSTFDPNVVWIIFSLFTQFKWICCRRFGRLDAYNVTMRRRCNVCAMCICWQTREAFIELICGTRTGCWPTN